jgi:nucleoside-diphosphate-sugar epimerase
VGERIFIAGASGVVGRRLVPLLVAAGHHVIGTTRVAEKTDELRALGAERGVGLARAEASWEPQQ